MTYFRFLIIFFLIAQYGFSAESYKLLVKSIYSISVKDTPIVSVVTQSYLDRVNQNPTTLTPPDENVVKIIENFFTLWKYNRYEATSKKYNGVSIFRYDNKGSGISYFFYLNVLIQLNQKTKNFVKMTYTGESQKIVFESGDFTIENNLQMKTSTSSPKEVEKNSE